MLSILEKQNNQGNNDNNPNPNFHIYLAFGQSNMDGAGEIKSQDLYFSERFKMMPTVDFPSKQRYKGNWYTDVSPLCRETSGLSPCDYFGRELVNYYLKKFL